MNVQWVGSKDKMGQAEASVSFLLPGCRKRHLARFYVMLYPGGKAEITSSNWTLKGVPKRIRDKLGESGLEQLRAECAKLFAEHGLAEMKQNAAERERQENKRKRKEVRNSLAHSFAMALELGFSVADIEGMLREAAVKRSWKRDLRERPSNIPRKAERRAERRSRTR